MADLGSEVRREVNAGIASVSRMMERLDTRENNRADQASVSHHMTDPVAEQSNHNGRETDAENPLNDSNTPAACAASSGLT